MTTISKVLHDLRKTLQIHTKFKVFIDENDEVSSWILFIENPIEILEGIKEKLI